MVSSQAQRDQVALAMERGHSQRQACELIELPRSILKYRSVRAERDAPALDAMRRIAATYPRYGYRRVRIFLRREGHSDESRPCLSALARCWPAIAAAASTAADRDVTAASIAGKRSESGVGVRLRSRCLRQRAEAQMSHHHRRVHARVPRHRCRRQHPLRPRH